MMRVMRNKAPAATLAYVDLVFRYLASPLYFLERLVRLLALVSRAGRKEKRKFRHYLRDQGQSNCSYLIKVFKKGYI